MGLNDFLGKLPTHQATIAAGIIAFLGTGGFLCTSGIRHEVPNPEVLTIWLGTVTLVLGVGAGSAYAKRASDINLALAKKGIVPPALVGVSPAPPPDPPDPAT